MRQVIDCFKTYLSILGYSTGMQRMLPACVHDFFEYGQHSRPDMVQAPDIVRFYEWLHERPLKRGEGALSEVMIYHYVYALRVFFSWQQQTGGIIFNPVSCLRFKSPVSGHREPLTVAEVQTLFSAAVTLKERAVLHLFYSCGLRRSEAVRLQLSDVHYRVQLLYVRSGKGKRRRVVPLTGRVSRELEQYVLQERRLSRYSGSAFMLNSTGRPMRGKSYVSLLKAPAAQSGA